jgi:hypothetical protein
MSIDLIRNSFEKGISFEEYLEKTETQIEKNDTSLLNEEELHLFEFTKLNLHRMKRVLKTHPIDSILAEKIKNIAEKQYWLLITENWCGDSAQCSPEFYKMSKLNENIELRIVERDLYPEVMDLYLTDGKKSIPILVVFNSEWNQLLKWGSRPKALQTQIDEWMSAGLAKEEWIEKMHLWYGRNRGKELFAEFNSLSVTS